MKKLLLVGLLLCAACERNAPIKRYPDGGIIPVEFVR
jgi:hypothetical protein